MPAPSSNPAALPCPSELTERSRQPAGLNQETARLQELLERARSLRDPGAQALVQECLQAMLAFYGEGLARMLQIIEGTGEGGQVVLNQVIQDRNVSGLLLIHGLHPLNLETRLRGALEKVRPYMQSHGGNVELVEVEQGRARLRLQGTCNGCPSSALTLEVAVRRAVEEACPDLAGFEVEGLEAAKPS